MIRRLEGEIAKKTNQAVVLNVQGVGYLIHTPQSIAGSLGEVVSLHTHLAVRENALDLYGFALEDELELFEQLLTLPKIGPKSALQILSQANVSLIKTAIANSDANHLSKMSGIGKKTAEKVVLGLSDLYEKQGLVLTPGELSGDGEASFITDTIDALVALGYSESDARKAVQQVRESEPDHNETNALLKAALKLLS